MRHEDVSEVFRILVLIVILLAIFPIATKMIFDTVLIGIVMGSMAAIFIIAIWWYLESKEYR